MKKGALMDFSEGGFCDTLRVQMRFSFQLGECWIFAGGGRKQAAPICAGGWGYLTPTKVPMKC